MVLLLPANIEIGHNQIRPQWHEQDNAEHELNNFIDKKCTDWGLPEDAPSRDGYFWYYSIESIRSRLCRLRADCVEVLTIFFLNLFVCVRHLVNDVQSSESPLTCPSASSFTIESREIGNKYQRHVVIDAVVCKRMKLMWVFLAMGSDVWMCRFGCLSEIRARGEKEG